MRDFDLSKITGNEPPLVTDDDKDAEIERLTAALHDEIRQHQGDADELNRLRASIELQKKTIEHLRQQRAERTAERDALIIQKREIHQIGYEVAAERDSARAEREALRELLREAREDAWVWVNESGDEFNHEETMSLINKIDAALAAKDGAEVSPIFTPADDLIASLKKGGSDEQI